MRAVAAALALVALGVVTVAWLQSPDDLTRHDAVRVAEGAFDAAGVDGALVDPDAEAGRYVPGDDRRGIAVWKTSATVEGGTVQLWLARSDGESVFLDDRAPDGSSQLLTESQFRLLADHFENPAVDRQVRRNMVLTVAAAAVALVAVRVTAATSRPGPVRWPARRRRRAPEATRRDRRRARRPLTARPARSAPPTRPNRPLRAEQESW